MAETNKPEKAVKDERVEVFIERAQSGDEPNLFVSINGKNYLLPRGKKSLVPPEVAWEINRAKRAEARLSEQINALIEAAQNK